MKSGTLEKKLKLTSTKFSTTNMHLFNSKGEIKKYETVEEILREFHDLRISFYHKRKEWLVKVKKEDVQRISNRVRFILMVINDELKVAKKRKDVLLAELEELKFDKMRAATRKPKAKNALATEEEEEDDKASYDYLLSMPLWNLTMEKVEALRKEEIERKQELNVLLETTKEQMWAVDLDQLEAALDIHEEGVAKDNKQTIRKVDTSMKSKPKAKGAAAKKAAPAKTTKKAKADMDDDSEDIKPAKKAPIKRAPAKKAASKKKEMSDSEDEGDFLESDDEDSKPAKKAPVKKAAVKKAPVKRAPAKKADRKSVV